MRALAAALLLAASALLAGCATPSAPVGDAEAAHAGAACPAGAFVDGFLATGAPNCSAPPEPAFPATACAAGEVVTGIEADGAPVCTDLMEVAQASMKNQPPPSQPSTPAKSLSVTSSGALASNTKAYTISSASPGMKWSDLRFTLDGTPLVYDGTDPANADNEFYVMDGQAIVPGEALPSTTLDAGDGLVLYHSALAGKTLRILDAQANSVILTLTVT